MKVMRRLTGIAFGVTLSASAVTKPTPGYQEQVLQWTVQAGETCNEVAEAIYGSKKHVQLLKRYNDLRCTGETLPAGLTLVVPAEPTKLPAASLQSMTPTVKTRSPGGTWVPAKNGMALHPKFSVNTLQEARANIQFRDRTNIQLGEHTLVVIYGTADETKLTKKEPPAVELQEGEVFAGLTALRGKPVKVKLKDGGMVSARSKDAIVRKQGKRTTVSVFSGSAEVRSGGQKLTVPKNFGSALVAKNPPTPPRALPPAPKWQATSDGIIVAGKGAGVIAASWSAVATAVAYRFELAQDPKFLRVVVREEVPSKVRSFRAEKLPAGTYFMRARALDAEDFLGLASASKTVTLVEVDIGGGLIDEKGVKASPYGQLEFTPDNSLEIAFDDGEFVTLPKQLDLHLIAPKELKIRVKGSDSQQVVKVEYTPAQALIRLTPKAEGVFDVYANLEGLEGLDIPERVAPKLITRRDGEAQSHTLSPVSGDANAFHATIEVADAGALDLEVVDRRGRILGSSTATFEVTGRQAATAPAAPRPNVHLATVPSSPTLGVAWWRPGERSFAVVSVAAARVGSNDSAQASVQANANVGDLGVNLRVGSHQLADPIDVDRAFWLGLSYLLTGSAQESLSLAGAFKLGLPGAADGPATRLEPSLAAAYDAYPFSLSSNLGLRARVARDRTENRVPPLQGFWLVGASYNFSSWFGGFALIDSHLLESTESLEVRGRGGLALGLQFGKTLFGGVSVRASPWADESGSHWLGQLNLGIRQSDD